MRGPELEAIKTLDPEAVFSVAEAAKLLGMTHNGVLNRIKRGGLKSGKSGARYFIPGREIQQQIQLPGEIDI